MIGKEENTVLFLHAPEHHLVNSNLVFIADKAEGVFFNGINKYLFHLLKN